MTAPTAPDDARMNVLCTVCHEHVEQATRAQAAEFLAAHALHHYTTTRCTR